MGLATGVAPPPQTQQQQQQPQPQQPPAPPGQPSGGNGGGGGGQGGGNGGQGGTPVRTTQRRTGDPSPVRYARPAIRTLRVAHAFAVYAGPERITSEFWVRLDQAATTPVTVVADVANAGRTPYRWQNATPDAADPSHATIPTPAAPSRVTVTLRIGGDAATVVVTYLRATITCRTSGDPTGESQAHVLANQSLGMRSLPALPAHLGRVFNQEDTHHVPAIGARMGAFFEYVARIEPAGLDPEAFAFTQRRRIVAFYIDPPPTVHIESSHGGQPGSDDSNDDALQDRGPRASQVIYDVDSPTIPIPQIAARTRIRFQARFEQYVCFRQWTREDSRISDPKATHITIETTIRQAHTADGNGSFDMTLEQPTSVSFGEGAGPAMFDANATVAGPMLPVAPAPAEPAE